MTCISSHNFPPGLFTAQNAAVFTVGRYQDGTVVQPSPAVLLVLVENLEALAETAWDLLDEFGGSTWSQAAEDAASSVLDWIDDLRAYQYTIIQGLDGHGSELFGRVTAPLLLGDYEHSGSISPQNMPDVERGVRILNLAACLVGQSPRIDVAIYWGNVENGLFNLSPDDPSAVAAAEARGRTWKSLPAKWADVRDHSRSARATTSKMAAAALALSAAAYMFLKK